MFNEENYNLYKLDYNEKIKLIEQNKYLDVFINDKNWVIRMAVVKKNYRLDKLINDKEATIRCKVAEQGYKLDVLINDKTKAVQQSVIEYCKEHPEKQECIDLLRLHNL